VDRHSDQFWEGRRRRRKKRRTNDDQGVTKAETNVMDPHDDAKVLLEEHDDEIIDFVAEREGAEPVADGMVTSNNVRGECISKKQKIH
jgi:hypothetical protein